MSDALKKTLRLLVPPLFGLLLRRLGKRRPKVLFDGDDALFRAALRPGCIYGEYGCGDSTIWVAHNVGCTILSVDSSPKWIETVQRACAGAPLELHLADVGPVGNWGRPLGYSRHANF